MSPVWLETLVFGSIWEVPEFSKSIFGTAGWEPSGSTKRGWFPLRGFVLSPVWLETLVFGSIWEVPDFSKSIFGTAG